MFVKKLFHIIYIFCNFDQNLWKLPIKELHFIYFAGMQHATFPKIERRKCLDIKENDIVMSSSFIKILKSAIFQRIFHRKRTFKVETLISFTEQRKRNYFLLYFLSLLCEINLKSLPKIRFYWSLILQAHCNDYIKSSKMRTDSYLIAADIINQVRFISNWG